MIDYTVMVCTHRPRIVSECVKSLCSAPVKIIDSTEYDSCSKLWNDAIVQCPTSVVIICNEKARPNPAHCAIASTLATSGFGIACLWWFGFFALHKQFTNIVGWFDEGLPGGGCEDVDMTLRMAEANVAHYACGAIPYAHLKSSWTHRGKKRAFRRKWKRNGGKYVRKLPDRKPSHGVQFETFPGIHFRRWSESVMVSDLHAIHGNKLLSNAYVPSTARM